MRQLSTLLPQYAVTLEAAQTTLPVPALVTDGGDCSTWLSGAFAPLEAELKITAVGTVTLSAAELFEWDGSIWCSLGALNNGTDIVLTATRGFKHPIYAPAGTRMAVAATLSAAVAVTAVATPREIHS